MRIILLIATAFTLSVEVNAQTKKEIAVSTAVESLRKAMVDADKVTLENLTAGKLSYGHSSGKVEDKSDFIETLTSGKSDFVKIALTEQTVKVVEKTALVRHNFLAETNDNGKSGTVHLSILLIWQKQKGKWKLLARQAVKIP